MKLLIFRLFKSLSAILESTKETKCISPVKTLTSLVMSQTLKQSSNTGVDEPGIGRVQSLVLWFSMFLNPDSQQVKISMLFRKV